MFERLTSIFKKERRPFEAFQIEVSTYCSAECQMCPKNCFPEEWTFDSMSMESFQRISPHFPLAKWVYLQGWGEPLENQHLMEMLKIAKEAGCRTGFTTNAALLTEEVCRNLLEVGLDLMVVSLGGAHKESHQQLRTGSNFERLIRHVEGLTKVKQEVKSDNPTLKLSMLMTRMNIQELPEVVTLAARLGADEFMGTNIDYLPGERCNILRAFHHESATEAFQESIDKAHQRGKELGIKVRTYPLKAEEVLVCEADPPKNLFVSVDGSVAPCIYLRIPKKGEIPRIFMHKQYMVPQTIFGNIHHKDLMEIWNEETYKSFRKVYEERRKAEFRVTQAFDVLSSLSSSSPTQEEQTIPPLPSVCTTCYKAYGL